MKNRTLRISLILAILTLVTSCFMGSTFAKYVTNNTGADTARVAKWGISIDVSGFKGFQTSYAKDDSTFIKADETVVATENVVAPGTTGTFGSFAVAGTPEVAVRVTYEATVVVSDWTVDGVYYWQAGTYICFEQEFYVALACYVFQPAVCGIVR